MMHYSDDPIFLVIAPAPSFPPRPALHNDLESSFGFFTVYTIGLCPQLPHL